MTNMKQPARAIALQAPGRRAFLPQQAPYYLKVLEVARVRGLQDFSSKEPCRLMHSRRKLQGSDRKRQQPPRQFWWCSS